MRILTVRQPWAWAIIHGGKTVENRARNIAGTYRGPVAIHVAGKYAEHGLDLPALSDASDTWCETNGCSRHPWTNNVGNIIGVVDLKDVHTSTGEVSGPCSPWALADHVHLELANPRALASPVHYRGALGLRRLDDVTIALIMERMEER